ncbi:MAG: heavy metal translocating P-type ATPase metal-binding domain-containing protein [Pirellulaceae bacterium]|nr:heavy metal translocating P-type ATPase metal-binding domain-containing protein [Pirellulaceae bacterium]
MALLEQTFDADRAATAAAVCPVAREQVVAHPCIHCGQATDVLASTDPQQVFCCSGCRSAYELIHGWGLDEFYALREQLRPASASAVVTGPDRYVQFDEPEFLGRSAPRLQADGTYMAELAVAGLHCAACAWLIENVATATPGWLSARVRMSDHSIRLVFDPKRTKLSSIAQLMGRMGYQLSPLDRSRDEHIQQESKRLLVQIAIAGFLAANSMWIAVALYAGEFTGVVFEYQYFLGLMGTALGTLAVVGPGRTFFVSAFAAIKSRTPHMDLPIALGLSVGTVVGIINAIRGSGYIFFDSLAALVFLLLIGRWIQFRQQQRAARAVDLMLRITPRHATRITEDGRTELVLAENLQHGQRIRIAPGECVAVDGVIVAGATTIDRSLLTGESIPVSGKCGDAVSAGTINITAPIDVAVEAVGRESRIGRVMQSVEAAAADKTPIVQLADRIGGKFVVRVMILAALTFVLWLPWGLGEATSHATSLLIVACPCALALATPLAIAVGLGRAAKCNVLIRDGQSLQKLASGGRMWLDKTGTLTEGRQRVSSLIGTNYGLQLAASIESKCVHPVASAIVREAELLKLTLFSSAVLDQAIPGGVLGTVDGQRVAVGNIDFIEAQHIAINPDWMEQIESLLGRGEAPLLIAIDGVICTLLGLSDPLRKGARETIAKLQRDGWSLGILSGDHPEIVSRVGQQLGLKVEDCCGGLSPEEKLEWVRSSRRKDLTVVMVGDGANDAAALAAADVGIAVRGGAEVSLQAAPVFVSSGQLTTIHNLIVGARRTNRVIYTLFAVSLGYNIFAVILAMCGWISPLAAALLMPISSVSVLAIVLASRTFEESN